MEFKIFLFMLAFNFSLITASNQLVKRNLASDNIKFLLIGFGDYSDDFTNNRTFNLHLLKYEINENYEKIYFDTDVIYQDLKKSYKVPVTCILNSDSRYQNVTYLCSVENNGANNITNLSLNNIQFIATNSSVVNLTFTEKQIKLSTLADSSRKKIEKETERLKFSIFYLNKSPIIKKDEVELNGNIKWNSKKESKYFYFNLSMPENVKCHYYYNCSEDNIDKIIFNPQNDVNIHLNAMMARINYSDKDYILIFANKYDDLILYSNDKYSYIELLGFKDYTKQTSKSDATAKAVLKGTLYSLSALKNIMRFTANTDNGTNITAYGIKNSEVQNNTMTYNVTFITLQQNDEPNTFYKDFVFYDSDIKEGIEQINVYPEYLLIRNEDWTKIKEILFPSKPKEVYNGLNFDFDNPNEFKDYTFERLANAYMSYIPLNENLREKIKCTFKNNTDSYNLICHPDKSFITYMNTLRMSVEGIRKSRRLRFLQTKENITFSSPLNSTELIDYTYDPDFNTFTKKVSKDKGLSAGAIVAIVLSCIAVVAAIGVAIFFLNRKPANPVKYVNNNNSYFQNSTAEINKQ